MNTGRMERVRCSCGADPTRPVGAVSPPASAPTLPPLPRRLATPSLPLRSRGAGAGRVRVGRPPTLPRRPRVAAYRDCAARAASSGRALLDPLLALALRPTARRTGGGGHLALLHQREVDLPPRRAGRGDLDLDPVAHP